MYPLNTSVVVELAHDGAHALAAAYAIQHSPGQLAMKYLYVKME